PPHKVHFVQNGWLETTPPLDRATARRALGLREDAFVIGWVGRLSAEKGPEVLLDALVKLTDLPVTVSAVGDGPERRSLGLQASRFGVERLVRLHGTVPDAGRLFAAFDVFVLSSHPDGTPIVLFEAMVACDAPRDPGRRSGDRAAGHQAAARARNAGHADRRGGVRWPGSGTTGPRTEARRRRPRSGDAGPERPRRRARNPPPRPAHQN